MINVDTLVTLLKCNSAISAYELTHFSKQSSELFFVGKGMELNRATNTEDINIVVYVDVDDKRGSSKVTVTSADDETSVNEKFNSAVKKAKTALNPFFPLAENQSIVNTKLQMEEDLNTTALKVADAIRKADCFQNGQLNATEIFVSLNTREFINSNGVKQYEEKYSIEFETIPTWANNKEEYELYKYYRNNAFDADNITEEVNEILKLSKYRSEAKKISEVNLPDNLPVLVYGEMASLIVRNLEENGTYQADVTHASHYEKGSVVSDTPFDLVLKGTIDGCSASCGFDENGVALTEKKLIEGGKMIDRFGDIRFGHYANEKHPAGNYSVAQLDTEGSEYKKQPYLIIDHFSAPQLENASGYFGGEVRLARYFDGEKMIPLTSFTVTGNIYEAMKDVRFSKESATTSNYAGPKYFIFDHLNIV